MSEHTRRVASPEGAQYYGLPIGAPITPDAKAAAKAKHGGSEPLGGSKFGGNKGGNASAATNAKAAMEKAASATPAKAPKTKTKLKKPSIKGNLHFKVGKTDYTAPNGSKLFHQKGVDGLAYVRTPDGKVHIFNENGEIETDSTAVLQALSQKFSQDIGPDDTDFEAAEFDKVGAHYSIDQMPIGGVLTDQRGNPVFTKNEDGTWHNEDLGVDLDEASVKPLFDAGDLIPEPTQSSEAVSTALADKEAVNLAELDYNEAVAAIDAMPEGTALQAGATVFIKGPDGWKSSSGGASFPASTVAYAKNDLKPADGVEITPDMVDDPKGAPAPTKDSYLPHPNVKATPAPEPTERAAASKQAIADANPYKPQPVDFSTVYPEDGQYPAETTKTQDIADAQPGDTMLATYYDGENPNVSDYFDIAVFTKQDDGTWWDQDSIQKLSPEDMDSLVKDSDVKVFPNKSNKGPEIARAKAVEAKKKAQEDAIKAATAQNADAPKKLDGSGSTANSMSQGSMVKGGSIKGDLKDLEIGHKVALKFNGKTGKGVASKTVYTKTEPDNWHQDNDPTSFGDKDSQWLKGQVNKSTSLTHEAYPETAAGGAGDEPPTTTDTPATPDVPDEPTTWDALQTGDTPTGEWSKNVGAGSQAVVTVGDASVTYTKSALNTWAGGGISLDEEQMSYALDKINAGESTASSIVAIKPKASLKKQVAPEVPEAPEDIDVPSNDVNAVGGKPETVDHLKEYPAATTLLYTKKDGSQSTYTKLDSGQYLTPNGVVMAPEQLKKAVSQGKFQVGSLPAQQVADVEGLDEKYLTPGTPIDKFGVLKQYPEGTVLHVTAVGYSDSQHPLVVTKQADGSWADTFGPYQPTDFESDIQNGHIYFHSVPQKQVSEQEAIDALTTGDYKTSDVPNLTFDSTGQAYSSKDVKGALDAFEGFSGFQLKYAFKGDDKQNPLAEQTESIKAWAKTAYPDLPPKAGAIKLFKNKLGITGTDEPVEKKNSNEGVPNISFGDKSDAIKGTATGFTGGEFNDQDVQQAIDILEGFQGKAFKNELNKKGNPLGTLSPNHLVGFDKDKTVTKQKFIDLMKQKLTDYHASKVEEGGPVEDPNLSDSALAKAGKDPEEVGDSFGLENIDDMPKGMAFQEADAGFGDETFTHVGDNLFESSETGLTIQSIDMPDTAYIVVKKPSPVDESQDDDFGFGFGSDAPKEETPEELAAWEKELLGLDDPEDAPAVPEGYTPHVSFPVRKKVGDKLETAEDFDNAAVGTKVVSDFGDPETKNADGTWSGSEGGTLFTTDQMVGMAKYANWSISHMPEDKPSLSRKGLSADDLDNYGVGTVIGQKLNGEDWLYKKNPDGSWDDLSYGFTIPEAEMKSTFAKEGNNGFLHSEPNPLPDYATTPSAVSALSDEDGEGGPDFNPSGLTVGKYSNGKGKAYMVVHADGTGTYVTGTGSAKKITVAAVKKNHDAGMNVYGGIPDTVPEVGTKASTKTPATKQPEVNLPDGVYFLGGKDLDETKVFEVEGDEVLVWADKFEKESVGYVAESVGTQKSKLKTKFLNGQIVDAEGDSIVPENHTGSVYVLNKATTIPSLIALKNAMDAGEIDNPLNYGTMVKINQMGVPFTVDGLNAKAVKDGLHNDYYMGYTVKNLVGQEAKDNIQVSSAKKILSDKIDKMLAGVDLTVPQGNAKDFFEWTANGEAEYPNVGATPYVYGPAPETNPFLKKVQAQFGGPDVMLPVALGKYEKANWINAFEEGNFAAMYQIEVSAAGSKNKSHAKGYMHPGFPGNSETNKVTWGAKVKGEYAPGNVPEGNWSSISPSDWSADEINNYLIAAHMQNPTHLSAPERRTWVQYHKTPGYAKNAENLSLNAQSRALAGDPPKTDPPVWTDDIKPAKSYDKVFEQHGEFPTNWGQYAYDVSQDWAKENWSPELKLAINEYATSVGYGPGFADNADSPAGLSMSIVESGVGLYFSKKKEAYEEELKKPVYSTVKSIAAGSHDVYLVKDQFDRQYIFKPADAGKEWRAEVEHMNISLSKAFGFTTPGSQLIEHEGKFGQMQEFLPNTGNLSVMELADGSSVKFDLGNLTEKQAADVAAEHVLDWILDNDDTHTENMLLTPSGGAVGIDKGRGLYVYGNWDGLSLGTSPGSGANTNAQVVYQQMYAKMTDGSLSQAHIDQAYKAAMKAAKRIQKQDDTRIEDMIREGVKNRPKWSPPGYMTHFSHEAAPKNVDDLVASVLERKSVISDEIDEMWGKIYAKAGLEKPTPPAKALGETHLSGWSEADLSEKVDAAKAHGASPIHASAAFVDGSSLIWSENLDGTSITKGQAKIGAISQKKILAFLQPKAKNATGMPSTVVDDFPNVGLKSWKSSISGAAKDITKNAIDKTYDKDIQDLFDATAANIQKDLEAWKPDMQSLGEFHVFPSGTNVPEGALLQYKAALQHYQVQVDKVKAAKETGESTNKSDFTVYTPVASVPKGKNYVNETTGESYTQLANGSYLFHQADGLVSPATKDEAVAGASGDDWTALNVDEPDAKGAIEVKLSGAGDYSGTVDKLGNKTVTSSWSESGHQGEEYEVTLPSGEKVWFRNSSSTSTMLSQQGMLRFQLNTADSREASLARVESFLSEMGLNPEGADEDTAQSVYWRQMFGRVILSTGGDSKVQAARDKLNAMTSDLTSKVGTSVESFSIPEAIGLSMNPDEEQKFWNDLAIETFGADKVSDWISGEGYLPNYNHMNLEDTEAQTGKAYFKRIDVDTAALQKKGTMIAIGNNGKDTALMNYISTGGMLSTEERLRVLGHFKQGASSGADQSSGGATGVFARVANGGAEHKGSLFGAHVAYWNPSVFEQTGTYAYNSDSYGRLSQLTSSNHFDVNKSLAYSSTDNEVLTQNNLSIFDHLEMMIFEDEQKRDEAIQRLKEQNLEVLRGLPIEERLVMRNNYKAAYDKIKSHMKTWSA